MVLGQLNSHLPCENTGEWKITQVTYTFRFAFANSHNLIEELSDR